MTRGLHGPDSSFTSKPKALAGPQATICSCGADEPTPLAPHAGPMSQLRWPPQPVPSSPTDNVPQRREVEVDLGQMWLDLLPADI